MAEVTLLAGRAKTVKTSALFLSIINADGNFEVKADEFGSLAGKVGRQYELPDSSEVEFVNKTSEKITVEFETANIKVHASGQGDVRVINDLIIGKVKEAIPVTAEATVENGKMSNLVSDSFAEIASNKRIIPAGQTVEVFPAKNKLNRSCLIQLITDNSDVGVMRLGTTITNAVNGKWFQGNKDAPQAYEWAIKTSVWVHNPNEFEIELAGGESWLA